MYYMVQMDNVSFSGGNNTDANQLERKYATLKQGEAMDLTMMLLKSQIEKTICVKTRSRI
jgi:hypothetical protein